MAYDISEAQFQKDLRITRYRNKKGTYKYEQKPVIPIESLNQRKNSIVSIVCKDFFMTRDKTAGRLHSNLTNLTSNLFPALSFKGKKLVGYDIANSQPILFTALNNMLNKENESARGQNIQNTSHTHTHLHTHIHTHTPTHTNTHLHTPTHTYTPKQTNKNKTKTKQNKNKNKNKTKQNKTKQNKTKPKPKPKQKQQKQNKAIS